MAAFVIVPRGPFALERAADVIQRFPPLRHQPPPAETRDGAPPVVRLAFIGDDHRPVAVSLRREAYGGVLHGTAAGAVDVDAVRRQVARIFALDVDGTDYPAIARRDPALAPVMEEHQGLRPVSFTSPYECACWANVSQRLTTTQAAKVMAELVRAHGEDVELDWGTPSEPRRDTLRAFPPPERLADVAHVAGLASAKVERLRGVARATLEGRLDAARLRGLPREEALAELRALPGIGPFWSSAILLRACGVHDVFPFEEPVSMGELAALHDLAPDAPELRAITERYRPFGMWVAFLLRVAANRRSPARPRAPRAASSRARARPAA